MCSLQVAAVVSSTFYSIWNLFSGFLIPQVSPWHVYRNPCMDHHHQCCSGQSSLDFAGATFSDHMKMRPLPQQFNQTWLTRARDSPTWQVSMPRWWFWYTYINPVYWTLYGLIGSQLVRAQASRELVSPWLPEGFGICKQACKRCGPSMRVRCPCSSCP